ncbi:MAG: hypothetical protein AAF446_10795, partial [Pseudomonadota bacterium]
MRTLTGIFLFTLCACSLPGKAQVLAEGAESVETFMGWRARNFNNDGARELFVGVPDLGQGANRNETDFIWANGGLTTFTVE